MDRNLFRYIWKHSRREQLLILGIVLLSLPFYFVSLDLPKYIVNDAIQGRAFTGGTIKRVAVDVSGEPYIDLEREAQAMMARE